MKTTNIFTLLALFFAFTFSASAQQSAFSFEKLNISAAELASTAETPHIFAYVANPFEVRDNAWWNSLENELSIADQSYRKVTTEALQNLIFFQTNHGGKVNLESSILTLLDIYGYHKSEGMRIMAVAALVEIGDAESLKTVEKNLYKQRTPRIRDYTIAALQDYKNN